MGKFATAIVLIAACIGAPGPARGADAELDLGAARARLEARYAGDLAGLAAWCARENLEGEAERTRAWSIPRKPDRLYLWLLPATGLDHALAPGDKRWRARLAKLRRAQADSLFELGRRAAAEGRSSLAAELVLEAAHENPDHDAARRMLGTSKFRGAWHTPFEIRQLTAGKVWNDKWGWLPEAHVARYNHGERYYRGRWMSAEEETRLRSDLRRGWKVESEHYLVTTNHSLEEGVRLVSQLERLYEIWQKVFIRYVVDEKELVQQFSGSTPKRGSGKKHNVVQYRSRQEYNDALRTAQPKIEMTLGIYFDTSRTANFFAGQDQEPGTIYHEATHQLFQECRGASRQVGRQQNFWIVEAIACYMESLDEHDGYFTLGGLDAGRLPAARQRLLEDRFYLPLAELMRLGMNDLQSSGQIGMLYSQASGMAAFFMHYGAGRYREALVDYLVAVYSGRDDLETLPELCGTSTSELDRQYRQYLEGAGDQRRGAGQEERKAGLEARD